MNKYNVKALADDCYPNVTVYTDGDATHEQKAALFRKWKQDDQGMTWTDFAKSAELAFGMGGALAVRWCRMWLCVERDGYTHS